MHFGYPGENTHLEHHGVSEESFWPSFTDIMMVIVMVFLLVTVAVILNNWTLIADLKNSIKAQKIASSLAENTQEQNHTLEDKLSSLERQVILLEARYQVEKTDHLSSQKKLNKINKILENKEKSISMLEIALSEKTNQLDSNKSELAQKVQLMLALQAKLDRSKLQDENNKEQQEEALQHLKKIQLSLEGERLTVKQTKNAYEKLKQSQQSLEKKLQQTTDRVTELEKEKQQLVSSFDQKLTQRETELVALKEKWDTRDSALRSLQGEYDSLDAKYQKLLLPARSSKGKYVVSVLYRKNAGKRIIRLKSTPNGSYTNINEVALHAKLKQLKNKHKTNLYLKVIIPENSGLSYSEAWKFTNALQKKYDYYFQGKSP